VTSIGKYSFRDCNRLVSIAIGNGIISFGDGVFSECYSIADFYCYAEKVPSTTSDGIFEYRAISKATLHVPAVSIPLYQGGKEWYYFKNIVALIDNDPKPE
jgi:hypothetical protein